MDRRHAVAELPGKESFIQVALPQPAGSIKGFIDQPSPRVPVLYKYIAERTITPPRKDLCEYDRIFDGVRGGFFALSHLQSF